MGDQIFADAQPAVANNIGKPWKPEGLVTLKLGLDAGKSYEQIATEMGRNAGGIASRIKLEVKALAAAGKTNDEIRAEWNITEAALNECLGVKQVAKPKPRVVKEPIVKDPALDLLLAPFEKRPPIGNTPAGGPPPPMFTDMDIVPPVQVSPVPTITLLNVIEDYRKQVEDLKQIIAMQAAQIEQLKNPSHEELNVLE